MAWANVQACHGGAESGPKGDFKAIMSEQMATGMEESELRGFASDAQGETGPEDHLSPEEQEARDLALALELSMREGQDGGDETAAAKEPAAAEENTELDDFAIAQQLQLEEEAALDAFHVAEGVDKFSKVKMRTRFQTQPGSSDSGGGQRRYGADDAEELFEQAQSIEAAFRPAKAEPRPLWPRRNKNLKGQGGDEEIITKHDLEQNASKNWSNFGDQMADVRIGDVTRDFKLNNRVVNSLKHQIKQQKNVSKGLSATVERDSIQTHAKGLDQKSRLVLHRLLNLGILNEVNGAVRTGKEAVVYHATGHFDSTAIETQEDDQPKSQQLEEGDGWQVSVGLDDIVLRDFAVKVFKTTLTEFKNRMNYTEGDHRMRHVAGLSHQNPRKVVRAWADREMRNLIRARRAGINCPYPVRVVDNVVLMEFIGKDGWAAPQLREVDLSPRKMEKAYLNTLFIMHALLVECKLVHADLSEYNLLYYKGEIVLIDLGQSMLPNHPNAEMFLAKDCANVTRFFENHGVKNVIPAEKLKDLLLQSLEQSREQALDEKAAKHPKAGLDPISDDAFPQTQDPSLQGETVPRNATADSAVEDQAIPGEVKLAEELGEFASVSFAHLLASARGSSTS